MKSNSHFLENLLKAIKSPEFERLSYPRFLDINLLKVKKIDLEIFKITYGKFYELTHPDFKWSGEVLLSIAKLNHKEPYLGEIAECIGLEKRSNSFKK